MTDQPTKGPYYIGAQNDAVYIVAGKPPAMNNDYPVHDADRTVVAKMVSGNYATDVANARLLVNAGELVAALKKSRETFAALGVQEEINRIDDILAKIKGDAS